MAWCKRRFLAISVEGFATRKAATAVAMSMLARNWKKETKKISMFSEFIRRNCSTLAPVMAEEKTKKGFMEEESFKHKSLYLCFEDCINRNKIQVIRSIRLSHLLAPRVHGGDDLKLQKVSYICGPITVVPHLMSTCVVGSKIIFFGGIVFPEKIDTTSRFKYSQSKEVYLFETDSSTDPNPGLQPSQLFKITRPNPVLVEVDEKLYRFSGHRDCESFELLEPIQDDWLPLDVPPRKYHNGFIHAIAGSKILLWGRNQTGVYMFDVNHPEKSWKELEPSFGYIPSIDGDDQLFITLKSPHGDGKGFLMFSINLEQPDLVLVAHITHTCDSLKPMEPLQLELPADKPPKSNYPRRCQFFHLGGQKVGIVFSCDRFRPEDIDDDDYMYPSHDEDEDNEDEDEDNEDEDEDNEDYNSGCYNGNSDGPDDTDKARVLVIIFEYEIADESMDIKYRLLSSRCLEYSTKNSEEDSQTDWSILRGAHVL